VSKKPWFVRQLKVYVPPGRDNRISREPEKPQEESGADRRHGVGSSRKERMRQLKIARLVGACLSQFMRAAYYLVRLWKLLDT
jgi:hypothetical protein